MIAPPDVLNFWFSPASQEKWFVRDPTFDAAIRETFLAPWYQAQARAYDDWMAAPEGALALIVLLDQFPRNMFRANALAFASDALALDYAKQAVAQGVDLALPDNRRRFIYLPYEHSEDLDDQKTCVRLFQERTQDAGGLEYALKHLEVIEAYGRFPHRNAVLGRANTPDEEAYLAKPGAGF